MLVVCEFFEADGKVFCDVLCEHCSETAKEMVLREEVIEDFVLQGKPIICDDCEASRCTICKRFPVPGQEWGRNGLCWECQRAIDIVTLAYAQV